MFYDDEDATDAEREQYLAGLAALEFPALGPADWRECGRATFSTVYGDGIFSGLGLSHQRGRGEEIEHLSVETELAGGQSLDRALSSLGRKLGQRGATVLRHEDLVQVVDQTARHFRRVVMSDGDWGAVAQWDDVVVTLSGTPWQVVGLELVNVDTTAYLQDTLLRHWR